MSRRLVILSGAGASLDSGVGSTDQLTRDVDAHVRTELATQRGVVELLDSILCCLRAYLPRQDEITFEHILEAIEDIGLLSMKVSRDGDSRNESYPLLGATHKLRDELGKFEHGHVFGLHTGYLRGIQETVLGYLKSRNDIGFMRAAFESLSRDASVASFTLNYDDLFDQVLDGHETGFIPGPEPRRFDSARLRFPDALDRPMHCHLHGSIRWGFRPKCELGRFDDPTDLFEFGSPGEAIRHPCSEYFYHTSQSGRWRLYAPLIVGLSKAEVLLRQPFFAYLHAFHQALEWCSDMLVVGYGFSDHHINAAMRDIFCRRPNRRLYIVDHDPHGDASKILKRFEHKLEAEGTAAIWGRQWGAQNPEPLEGYPEWSCTYAEDPNGKVLPPVAIWPNGFKSFCKSVAEMGLPAASALSPKAL